MRSRSLLIALLIVSAVAASSAARAEGPEGPVAPVLLARDAKQPAVTVGADGKVFVTYLRGGNVVVAVSRDRGASFDAPHVAIDADGRARGGRRRGPRIGVSRDGVLVVTAPLTFDAAEAAERYPTPELYITTSSDTGATWTAPVRVNEIEKQAPEGLHDMVVAPDGTVHVAWLDRRERGKRGQDLWYARAALGKVGPNVRIAQDVCECCAPGLAVDGKGNPCIAWREGGEEQSREIFTVCSADGGRTFGEPARLNPVETKEHT